MKYEQRDYKKISREKLEYDLWIAEITIHCHRITIIDMEQREKEANSKLKKAQARIKKLKKAHKQMMIDFNSVFKGRTAARNRVLDLEYTLRKIMKGNKDEEAKN